MQEHGMSKIVSVKFHKAGEEAQPGEMKPLVPPPSVKTVDEEEDAPHKREETLEIVMAK
jgi:hypothetical protein